MFRRFPNATSVPGLRRHHRNRLTAFAGVTLGFAGLFTGNVSADPIGIVPTGIVDTDGDRAESVDAILQRGRELESARMWGEAIEHYTDATRKYPDDASVYQRLITCRLRVDVVRRMADTSYVTAVRQLSTSQALDLYGEVLVNLQTHHVDDMDWSRVMIFGTAALETALTDDDFTSRMIPGTPAETVDDFHRNIYRRVADRNTDTRFDLRAAVAQVAEMAGRELAIRPAAVVMEYVAGAMSTLDPYTQLLSPQELDSMFSDIEGNFVGLGVELKTAGDELQILSVIPGGPAEEAGLRAGQYITAVDGIAGSDAGAERIADLLRGPEFSTVRLMVRDGESADAMVCSRRRVEVPCVENAHIVDPTTGVAYMRVTHFQKSTADDVQRRLWELHRDGMRSLVIDLRGNPGGLLSAAVEMADRFLSDGRIVTTRGRNTRENFEYVAHQPGTWSVPVAVLIDGDSASASEIFAGAIADNRRGAIVGETSYGKGSVQGIFRMRAAPFGLKLTTAKFYSPSDRAISLNGVEPTVRVSTPYVAARPTEDGRIATDRDDAVLTAAVRELSRSVAGRPRLDR